MTGHTGHACSTSRLLRGALIVAVGIGAVAVATVEAQLPASAARTAITGITVDSARGATASTAIGGDEPSVSGDGRSVVFSSAPAGSDAASTVYLRDRAASALRELTVASEGIRPGESRAPTISSDGCTVTVVTEMAFDLFRDDDTGQRWDVYQIELVACGGREEWQLVSTSLTGDALNRVDPAAGVSVSSNGTVVAFSAAADPYDPSPWPTAVSVVDLTVPSGDLGRIRQVPGLPTERPTAGSRYLGQGEPAVSGNGRFVAFTSDATAAEPAPAWAESVGGRAPATQVFVWDRVLDATSIVSALPGASPTGTAGQPSVSDDGSVIAFASTSTLLVAARYPACSQQACRATQVFAAIYEIDADGAASPDGFQLVSAAPAESSDAPLVAGDAASGQPAVTGLSTGVAFVTRARNLVSTSTTFSSDASTGDLLFADLQTRAVRRLSVRPDGASPAVGAHSAPVVSENGRVVTFESASPTELAPGAPAGSTSEVLSASLPVELSMPSLDIGSVPVNWPSTEWYVSVANRGLTPFVPATVVSSSPAFMITGGTCAPNTVVAPGESCSVNVVFYPRTPGPASASITVAEQGFGSAAITTSVVASGGEPMLSADPAGADLGTLDVGSASSPTKVTVTNSGFFDTIVATVALSGLNPGDFRLVSDTCTARALPLGAACEIDVLFSPTAAGPRTALVTVTTLEGSRTSAIVAGEGHLTGMMMAEPVARVGQAFDVVGAGFAPDSTVVLSFADGSGRGLVVATDSVGAFVAQIRLPVNERVGARVLVASDPTGDVTPATAPVLVLPRGAVSPALPLYPGR